MVNWEGDRKSKSAVEMVISRAGAFVLANQWIIVLVCSSKYPAKIKCVFFSPKLRYKGHYLRARSFWFYMQDILSLSSQ